MLSFDPKKRPTPKEILEHPFLGGMNSANIEEHSPEKISIKFTRNLRNGSYYNIFSGTIYENDNREYALKIPKTQKNKKLLNEDSILRYLHQDAQAPFSHIIERIGLFGNQNRPYLALKLLSGNLKDYVEYTEKGISLEETKEITRQLVKALCFLFEKKVIHSDIKPEHVLMSLDKKTIALSDFSSACFARSMYTRPRVNEDDSISYRSPEAFLGTPLTLAVDVWNLATTIAQIYCKNVLFEVSEKKSDLPTYYYYRLGGNFYKNFNSVYSLDENRINFNEKIPQIESLTDLINAASCFKGENAYFLKELLYKMLVYPPENRPSPSDIFKDPFLHATADVSSIDNKESNPKKTFQKTYRNCDPLLNEGF
jgi:serine/threonine protein kinase